VQHLQKLMEEASLHAAESFAADYANLVPRFVEQIVRAIETRDRDLTLNASLNLKTKSWLVGALKMNQLCAELELALALGDWSTVAAAARDIELHLPRLQKALAEAPDLAFRTRRPGKLQTAMAS
jgi:hypothetical protein